MLFGSWGKTLRTRTRMARECLECVGGLHDEWLRER